MRRAKRHHPFSSVSYMDEKCPRGGLIFFCLLFFHQGKKRRCGIGSEAPHKPRQMQEFTRAN